MHDENNDLRGPENNLEGSTATEPQGPETPEAQDRRQDVELDHLRRRVRDLEERNEELEGELDQRDTLPAAPTASTASGSGGGTGVDRPADPRTGGESYVVNEGGDPLTYRVVDVDEDGKATGFRLARVVVRGDALVLAELEAQAPAEMNAAEVAALQRRIDDLTRERG